MQQHLCAFGVPTTFPETFLGKDTRHTEQGAQAQTMRETYGAHTLEVHNFLTQCEGWIVLCLLAVKAAITLAQPLHR